MSASTNEIALELSHVTKRYGALTVLQDAGLTVRSGTVHALLGENGAGKTTLMRIAYGMIRDDAGQMSVAGRAVSFASPLDAITAGIGMVHQHFTLVPTMTVAENLALGGRGRIRRADMVARVQVIADRTGFALDPSARIEALSVGAQQRVEIAKALAHDATLLILDEPTAVLAPAEIDGLLAWLRAYAAAGHAVVLITHKLQEALAVADDVTVLRQGRVVHSGPARHVSELFLKDAMLGLAPSVPAVISGVAPSVPAVSMGPDHRAGASAVFRARSISICDANGNVRVRDASFTIHDGDLVGIAAVEGSGQRELVRALSGRWNVCAGDLDRPADVGFVPEDRHQDAVLLDRSVAETVALRGAGARRGVMHWAAIRERTEDMIRKYDVRAPGSRTIVRSLSGGNQQKLVLARELTSSRGETDARTLVAENPTRGLDVRATLDVHERLRAVCATGGVVIVYSSDLDEVIALASRVFVLFQGALREVGLDRDSIGRAMLGLESSRTVGP